MYWLDILNRICIFGGQIFKNLMLRDYGKE